MDKAPETDTGRDSTPEGGDDMQQLAESEADLRRYIRPKRIVQQYGLSESVVYGGIYSGDLPAIKFRGRAWLIKPEDAEDWIQRNSEPNTRAA